LCEKEKYASFSRISAQDGSARKACAAGHEANGFGREIGFVFRLMCMPDLGRLVQEIEDQETALNQGRPASR